MGDTAESEVKEAIWTHEQMPQASLWGEIGCLLGLELASTRSVSLLAQRMAAARHRPLGSQKTLIEDPPQTAFGTFWFGCWS